MNAAETSASSAMADWTPLTVVSRSRTTAEMDTFINEVSTTSTNMAIESRMARRLLPVVGSAGAASGESVIGRLPRVGRLPGHSATNILLVEQSASLGT